MPSVSDLAGAPTSLPKEVQDLAAKAARSAFARARLLQPYLANFMGHISVMQSEKVGDTFAVTPDLFLIYNPAFILGLNEAGRNPYTDEPMTLWEYGAAFLHESLHIVFDHFTRFNKYRVEMKIEDTPATRHTWNIAGDCEINVILRDLVPINPNYEYIFTTAMTTRAGLDSWEWGRMGLEKKRAAADAYAMKLWKTLPLEGRPGEGKYPKGMAADWPVNGVNLPEWFCFPETSLDPPQGPRGTAESYYPFVPERKPDGPPPGPKPPPPPWGGWKIGDRVVDKKTGEVGIVTRATAYNKDGNPPQEIEVTVTNHFTESPRGVDDAIEIGAIARAKAEAGFTQADIAATKEAVEKRNTAIVQAAEGVPDDEWDKRHEGED